jgi:ABC-2 type transport system ATP-binding protein
MISIQDLHFNYGKQPVLKGLNLELQPGHIYGLLGSNGTGKSTLLKNLAGTLFPRKGKIDVFGFNPVERIPTYLQKIFMLPEEFYLPGFTIKRLIKGLAPFYPFFSKEDFHKYLYEFEIPIDNSIDEMSLGQKKKTLIAFGLACNTDLLLLDEPTNGLDIISKSQFRKIMATITNPSRYVIISTHQVQDLQNLIDQVIIINNGKVVFDQSMLTIAQKLSFGIAREDYEYERALYAEKKLKGSAIICANNTGEESHVDLELLYKSVFLSNEAIVSQFNGHE